MELATYVEALRDQLIAAADSGGPESRAAVERLAPGLEAAMRLALLEALSAAADEITRELAPGAVEVRLRGSDPDFVVTVPAYEASDVAASATRRLPHRHRRPATTRAAPPGSTSGSRKDSRERSRRRRGARACL